MMSEFRSRSQISIFNYPEYLNPFYEADNHKRLRFWNIEKNVNKNSSRRGSFTFGSFKNLFQLNSFRLTKKSSSLGINKTSESPPALRKDFGSNKFDESNKYASYDAHFRHTISVSKNAGSLQNLNENIFANRNNCYRRTIQSGTDGRRQYFSGSITPTLRNRYPSSEMTPGSSMNSVNTNPFEIQSEDDFSENLNTTCQKRQKKKKRKAPLPPVFMKSESGEIKNNAESNEFFRMSEVAKLTAEFERDFVKSKLELPDKNRDEFLPQGETVNIHEENDADDKVKAVMLQNHNEESKETKPEIQDYTKDDLREETPDYIPMTVREKFHVLRIEENFEKTDETVSKTFSPTITRERTPIPRALSENFAQTNSIRVQKQETPIMFHDDIELCILKKKEPPIPPRRRRSVKEIIESINRSQQLLLKPTDKIIPKSETKFQCDSSKALSYERENEERINKLLTDLQNFNKTD